MNKPQNIILICIDALRFDCIGLEKNKTLVSQYISKQAIRTPVIDSIAEKGVRFSQTITTSSYTTSSHASLFTGLNPPGHGLREFFGKTLRKNKVTLAEVLKNNGYRTVHSCEFPYSHLVGLSKGVEHQFHGRDNKLFEFLKKRRKENIFLFAHFFDIHDPYGYCENEIYPGYNDDYFNNFEKLKKMANVPCEGEKPYRKEYRDILKHYYKASDFSALFTEYVNGIKKFDNGRFRIFMENLKALGMLENTLLILFSDHGEGPCQSHFGHGADLYDGIIRIPLMMVYPGTFPDDLEVNSQVRTIDIFPTILELILNKNEFDTFTETNNHDGVSLLPYIFTDEKRDLPAYSEVWMQNASAEEMTRFIDTCVAKDKLYKPTYTSSIYQRSIRTPEFKCILQGNMDLVDGIIKIGGTDEEYVRSLYRNILRRIEDEAGLSDWIKKLQQNEVERQDLIDIFRQTPEAKNINRLFNLKTDPFELENLLKENDFATCLPVFKKFVGMIDRINDTGIADYDEIFYSSEEERDRVERELKNLGYLG